MQSNYFKQDNYAEQKVRLKKALRCEFYVEALAIEYAMIEDRINSILLHTGYSVADKNGNSYPLYKKLNKLKDNTFFNQKEIRKRLPRDLLVEIDKWREERNTIIHALMSTQFQSGQFKKIALQGDYLRGQIDNKASSIKRYMIKLEEANK